MGKKVLFLFVLGVISMQSCDDSEKAPQSALQDAFNALYPSASDVDWETNGSYNVADFDNKNTSITAWFDNNNQWQMSETDIRYEALPDAIKSAFSASEYGTWTVEDVDKIERLGIETVYVIEVERGEDDVDLYYSSDGVLIKTVADMSESSSGDNYVPQPPVASMVNATVLKMYPNARIVDIEKENGMTEVEIIDGVFCRDVYFNSSDVWIYTQTDVNVNSLPQIVSATIASSYLGYRIDDVEFFETPSGNYYQFELEKGNVEIKVKIDEAGKLIA